MICDVPIPHLPAIWPHVRGHIKRVLDREKIQRYELRDILQTLIEGKAKLWVVWNAETKTADAAIITVITQYPRLKELGIEIVGGRNMKAWAKESLRIVEEYGKAQGCAVVVGRNRKGWLRVGGPEFRDVGITMQKELRG